MYTKKQYEYMNKATKRWNFKTGATRSGKTHLDINHIIPSRILERKDKDGISVILGVTKETIERNILLPMRNIYGNNLVSEINSRNKATIYEEEIYCLGAEKVNQVSKLRGASFKYVYGDEVAEWHPEVFQLLKSRLDKPFSCFDGTLNPKNPKHWVKKFMDSDVDKYIQEYNIDDNTYLDPTFVANLKNEYKGTIYYDRYILGKWCNAEGLVYDSFSYDKNVVKINPHFEFSQYYVSCDYGTQNPTVFLMWGLYDKKWYLIKEYFYHAKATKTNEVKRQKTDREYTKEYLNFIGNKEITAMIVDPSACSFIAELEQNGVNVVKAKNSVIDGIRFTASLLNQQKIYIGDKCQNTLEEFELYVWNEKIQDDDMVLKENDHCLDALRYFCYTILAHQTELIFA